MRNNNYLSLIYLKKNSSSDDEHPSYDTKPWLDFSSGALGYVEYPFIAITPKSTLTRR